jgi:hypothetical protein
VRTLTYKDIELFAIMSGDVNQFCGSPSGGTCRRRTRSGYPGEPRGQSSRTPWLLRSDAAADPLPVPAADRNAVTLLSARMRTIVNIKNVLHRELRVTLSG